MERICGNCGSLVSGDVKFCPMCGEPMKSAVSLDKPPADNGIISNEIPQTGYAEPQYRNSGNNSISPYYGGYQRGVETLSTSQWVGIIVLCSLLGPISFVLNLVWGFGSDIPEPRRSFSRAMFIVNIISAVLSGIFAGILGATGFFDTFI